MTGLFDKFLDHTPEGKQQHRETEERIAQGTASYVAHQETQRLTQEIRRKYNRLMLMNQAMWEILESRLGVTKEELAARMDEIDLRDGVRNQKVVKAAPDCPECGAKVCMELHRCLFCGYVPKDRGDLFEPMI